MSPLLTLASFVQDLRSTPVGDLDVDGIHEARAAVSRRNRLTDLVTGGVDRTVGITYGTAPARDDHEIPLRIYRPRALPDARTDVPVVMWFHGGGWVLADLVGDDPICTRLAAEVGCVVVSVDYRLAPEHRAPTAAHDCVDATTWVRASGDVLRADTSRMAVAGDSAGGNLAAVVAQVLRDHGDHRLRHQALIYPATDLTMSSPSIDEHANAAGLTRRSMSAFRDHYVPAGHDRREVAARRVAGDRHPRGVGPQHVAAHPDPGRRVDAVVDRDGRPVLRCHPVVDRDHDAAHLRGDEGADRVVVDDVTEHPTTAVEPHDDGHVGAGVAQ